MPSVLSIGVFDSVHLGHQALLRTARRIADERGASVFVLALDPHPSTILRPDAVPPRVIGREDKSALLGAAGADSVAILEPTPELLHESPDVFIAQIRKAYDPVAIVEGPDFRFGYKRTGDFDTLRAAGFDVHVEDKAQIVLSDLVTADVSSSLVRTLVAQGRVADAARCLGRDWSLTSTVVKGDQRGRTIGIPTVNLDLAPLATFIRPAPGVYTGTAELADGSTHTAAISVGDKPTFQGRAFTIEAHLLDFTGDLYGQRVTLRFSRWLRDQLPFPTVGTLVEQMQRDLAATREFAAIG